MLFEPGTSIWIGKHVPIDGYGGCIRRDGQTDRRGVGTGRQMYINLFWYRGMREIARVAVPVCIDSDDARGELYAVCEPSGSVICPTSRLGRVYSCGILGPLPLLILPR